MRRLASWLAGVVVCLLALSVNGLAESQTHAGEYEEYPTRVGVWLGRLAERECGIECQQKLLVSLRRITGLQQIEFDNEGRLVVCDWTAYVAGSAAARAVLFRALNHDSVYLIEDHTGSPAVTFGQLDAGLIYERPEQNLRLKVWRVRLDPADFKRIEAPAVVLAAFDVGFAFLHELLHGLGYEDANELYEVGACEEVMNEVRDELGLPQRAQYFGHVLPITNQVFTVRLAFRDPLPPSDPLTGKRPKRRTYQLFFAPEMAYQARFQEEVNAQNFIRRRR